MSTVYDDYSRERIGWFFGLTGWQLAVVAGSAVPVFAAVARGDWRAVAIWAGVWLVVTGLAVAPVRGRSAIGWLAASAAFALAGARGWSVFRCAAATGSLTEENRADLPGVLAGVEVHEGPPTGPSGVRVAIVQDHATRCWAVTAAVVHPGIGMADPAHRSRYGAALAGLLDLAARTELIDEVHLMVRTVPDDGAERDQWVAAHRRPGSPGVSRAINDTLAATLTAATVRTEAYVTLVVPESRLARPAREYGGGLEGRARVLSAVMAEVTPHLTGGLGMTAVSWLTSPQLALACRTGFAPADRAAVIDAHTARTHRHTGDGGGGAREGDGGGGGDGVLVVDEVPWALAGPSGAEQAVRHYRHDAWASVASTIMLPARGAVIGALAPILVPAQPGERRSFVVVYPVIPTARAGRQTANRAWAADMGEAARDRLGIREKATRRHERAKAAGMDTKLAHGASLTRPYAVACVTVPAGSRVPEFGRRLDAAIRYAGFAPLRLDLAQDRGFVTATIPLGVSLTRRGDTR